jgi:hypothetical protein
MYEAHYLSGTAAGTESNHRPTKRSPEELRAEFWRLPDDAMVDRPTIAAAFYLSVASMEALAVKGGGPKYTRINRRALYRKRDGLQWAATTGRTVENTSQLCEYSASTVLK